MIIQSVRLCRHASLRNQKVSGVVMVYVVDSNTTVLRVLAERYQNTEGKEASEALVQSHACSCSLSHMLN